MKIAIAGAGIAGLTLAAACQRAGMEVSIYEKADKLENIGGGLLLWPHGLRYLEEMGLLDCLQSERMTARRVSISGHDGKVIFSEDNAELNGLMHGAICPIDRSALQQRLLSCLQGGSLHLGKACSVVETLHDKVILRLSDGSDVDADIVIGADGIHSPLRACLYPEIRPHFTGFCWWGGIVKADVVPNFPKDEAQFIMGINRLCSIWPTQGDHFMWYLPVKMPLDDFMSRADKKSIAEDLCEEWNQDVMRLVMAPQMGQSFHLPIYEVQPFQQTATKALLIGDAACAFGPLLGQGANKAIEDAYILFLLLKTGNLSAVMQRFHQLRLHRHQRLFNLEQLSAQALMHDSLSLLQHFEKHLPLINLKDMYQDMIPLVNRTACEQLRLETLSGI